MKSHTYLILFRVSNIFMLVSAMVLPIMACGPYNPIIPTPEFFTSKWSGKSKKDFEKKENLLLWQQLTSENIPLSEIEEAVYQDSAEKMLGIIQYSKPLTENRFHVFLKIMKDDEILHFLYNAKTLEERRANLNSPWHYPSSRNSEATDDFQDLIDRFKSYKGERLRDRYALQTVRALFASRQYDKCVEYYDSAFAKFPESNLFKRMAMDYVAGCWAHLGNHDTANRYFAKTGNLWSLRVDDPVSYMADINPDNVELLEYLQKCSSDSAKICNLKPVAEKVLKTAKVKNRGDWEFALAYIASEYRNDYKDASRHIRRGLSASFSSEDLRDHAVAYRIKCDAANGTLSTLLSDLKWFEKKIEFLTSDTNEWDRMLRNIVYVHWVPKLWKAGNYSTAILLCGYADNLFRSRQRHPQWDNSSSYLCFDAVYSMALSEIHCSEQYDSPNDYSNLSFQLMGSLQSSQLIDVYRQMAADTPLFSFLKRYARTDKDYIYELIGTLALREENYERAMKYFASVSENYQKTMNIYKDGYLKRNPFVAYPTRWESHTYGNTTWEYEYGCSNKNCEQAYNPCHAKLVFASKMYGYQQDMKNGKSSDERGLARLRYAIGRHNSFEECWALTQYWRGSCIPSLFYPTLQYWEEKSNSYCFLYDYEETVGHKKTEELYQNECKEAMAMLQSDEARAEAEYLFRNVRTIIKHYPNTSTAKVVRTSCDNWHSWL